MQSASVPLTILLCGSAVLMVSGTLTRLDVEEAMEARAAALAADVGQDEGQDGELEGETLPLAGEMLVAVPTMEDPYFAGTQIYLLAHDESGALGLVVNRPRPSSDDRFTIYEGGPVAQVRVLALHEDPRRGVQVEPGIYAAADSSVIDDVLHGEVRGRVFIGYAGWGPGQLEREMAEGAWTVAPASDVDVFGAPAWVPCH